MSKLIMSLGAIIALTTVFAIPTTFLTMHIAKASSCSVTASGGTARDPTHSSCSAAGAASAVSGATAIAVSGKSSCATAGTTTGAFGTGTFFTNNGAVSCNSHSP